MPECLYTLTVSASHDSHQGVTGIGIVIRESRAAGRPGPIIAQLSESYHDAPPRTAEALAILRAFEIALERGYSHVKVRSHQNQERKELRAKHREGASVPDPIRARVLELARHFTVIRFGHVARRKNQLARKLAREARLGAATLTTGVADPRAGGSLPVLDSNTADLWVDDLFSPDGSDDEDDDDLPF